MAISGVLPTGPSYVLRISKYQYTVTAQIKILPVKKKKIKLQVLEESQVEYSYRGCTSGMAVSGRRASYLAVYFVLVR